MTPKQASGTVPCVVLCLSFVPNSWRLSFFQHRKFATYMEKRDNPVNGDKSPSKKRRIGGQARLEAFFNASSTKQQTAQSEGSSSSARQKTTYAKGDTPLQPLVIDVDEKDVDANAATVQPTPMPKTKDTQRHMRPMDTRRLQFASLDADPIGYLPDEQPWLGNGAPYAFLAHTLSTLSQTRSRITIINALTNCLRTIIAKHPESLLPSLYLLSNTLAPPYVTFELGLGPSIISRSIQNVSGITPATLKRLYNTLGDPGDVAVSAKSNLRTLIPHPPLTISYVYESLLKIAHSKGQGAAKQKEKIVEKLLLSASGEEVRFLTRTLCQNLRVGAVRTSILTALARAIVLSHVSSDTPEDGCSLRISSTLLAKAQKLPPDVKKKHQDPTRTKLNEMFSRAEELVKRVFVKHPNYDDIVAALLDTGLPGLEKSVPLVIGWFHSIFCHENLTFGSGIPLHPTLGSPIRSLLEVYERLGDQPFVAEFKYDGQRAQVHAIWENGQLTNFKIFSRHLEDMTTKVLGSASVQNLIAHLSFPSLSIPTFKISYHPS